MSNNGSSPQDGQEGSDRTDQETSFQGHLSGTKNEAFLEQTRDNLKQILGPYQQELRQKQRMADFLNQCIRHVAKEDFLQLDDLLKSKMAEHLTQDETLCSCREPFRLLKAYANEKVERYRMAFVEDLGNLATEVDLSMEIDFPRFTSLKGIEGTVDFSKRCTTINKKTLKTIDPRRIVTAVLRVKRQLYDRPFDPQPFVDGLFQTYSQILKRGKRTVAGHPVPIQQFYLDHVLSLQSKPFFQNMEKGKFREYTVEQFAVDIWRYFQSGIGGTSGGHLLQLRPGRNNSLWLIDSDGERRRITSISFQKET